MEGARTQALVMSTDRIVGEALACALAEEGYDARSAHPDDQPCAAIGVLVVHGDIEPGGDGRGLSDWLGTQTTLVLGCGGAVQAGVGHDVPYVQLPADADYHDVLRILSGARGTSDLDRVAPADTAPGSVAHRGSQLTGREREMLALLLEGSDTQEIATILSVTRNTVRTHLQNVSSKVGTSTRAELVAWAIREGDLDASEPQVGR